MWKEFKEFVARGNVMDLAVAVILGAAFGAIVNSFVADVITPAILSPVMKAAGVENLASLTWNGIVYGRFLAAVLYFLIIAFVMFLVVRAYNHFMRKPETQAPAAPPVASREEVLLEQIRDLLARDTAPRPAA